MNFLTNLSFTLAFLAFSVAGANSAELNSLSCDIKVLGDVPVKQSHRQTGADNHYNTDLLYDNQWVNITVGVVRPGKLSEIYKPEDHGLPAPELMKKVHDRYENVWREHLFSETELKGKKQQPLGPLQGDTSVWDVKFEQNKSTVALWSAANTAESIIVVMLNAIPSEGVSETLSESGAYTLVEDTLSHCRIN